MLSNKIVRIIIVIGCLIGAIALTGFLKESQKQAYEMGFKEGKDKGWNDGLDTIQSILNETHRKIEQDSLHTAVVVFDTKKSNVYFLHAKDFQQVK